MKPLSIEELKAMELGDWVWIVEKENAYPNNYFHGEYCHITPPYIDGLCYGWQGSGGCYKYSNYGTKWLAYKNKEQAECKGELVELPRIIHPNELEWFVQYQYPSGIINDEIFYSLEQAEQKLKELRGKV